jgi:uncharacterized protein with PIN domain
MCNLLFANNRLKLVVVKVAHFDFPPDLQLLLPLGKRQGSFDYNFTGPQTAKHLIESLGVPHTEVGELSANGAAIGLDYLVHDGDRIEVRPAAPGCPVEARFLLDSHLGRLAAYLRMLGFDCLYRNDYQDVELAELVGRENRILLSRDRRLLMRKVVHYGYCPRSLDPRQQLVEVVRRFDLREEVQPFHRCLRCNALLEPVSKEAVLERLEPLTKTYFNEFAICSSCDQVYWKGSHYERMMGLVQKISLRHPS